MDVTTPIITTTATTTTPETETETPPTKLTDHHHHHNHQTHRHQSKVLSFTNGALKQHHHHHHSTTSSVVVYKECLKNHAATLGGHAVDGCGEFMPSPTTNPTDPTSLKCAACGCHRNFHRRDPDDGSTHIIEYHHHLPPPPPLQPPRVRSPNSVSPPPISSSYYPSSAPHMLLALSTGVAGKPDTHPMVNNTTTPINMGNRNEGSNNKKRFRTKFSVEQKEKMQIFAERLGWKMQKRDERLVEDFCNEIGVCRGVLKVWMHNNKHTFGKRDHVNSSSTSNPHNNNNNNNNNTSSHNNHNNHHGCSAPVVTNGSSSSS